MTDTATQPVKKRVLNPTNNFIHDVLVVNTNLIGDKLLGILAYMLGEEDDHGVWTIVFSEEYPRDADKDMPLSRIYPEVRTVIINLRAHLEEAMETMYDESCMMSLWPYLWQQIIRSLYHEIRHAEEFSDADNIYDVAVDGEFEARAEEYAAERLVALAQDVDIEPPAVEDFPYFSEEVGLLLKTIMEITEPGAAEERQQVMLRKGYTVYKPGVDTEPDIKCNTLREFFQLSSDTAVEGWQKPVKTMADMVAEIPKVEATELEDEIVLEVVEKPVADVDVDSVIIDEVPADTKPVATNMPLFPEPGVNTTGGFTEPGVTVGDYADDEGVPFNPDEGAGEDAENVFDEWDPEPSTASGALNVKAAPFIPPQVAPGTTTNHGPLDLPERQPEMPQPVKQLEPHGLTRPEMNAALEAVLMRLYLHLFQKCGFNPQSEIGFINAVAITEPVFIGDIPGANKLFHTTTVIENKQKVDKIIDTHISGRVMPKSGLPGYHLHLNINGMSVKRSFLPQNHNKMNNGVLSKWATLARQGVCIGMLLQDGRGVRADVSNETGNVLFTLDRFSK